MSTCFERPWLVGLLDALLAVRDDHLTGLVSGLYVGDEPVAAQFGLRTGDLLVGWFTAYDARFRKYSPGLIQLKKMIQELAASGIRAIDMGGGAKNSYKETLKSHETVVARGIVTDWSVPELRTASATPPRGGLQALPTSIRVSTVLLIRSSAALASPAESTAGCYRFGVVAFPA